MIKSINEGAKYYYHINNIREGCSEILPGFPFIISLAKVGADPSDPDYINANGDYSVTPAVFRHDANPAYTFVIQEIVFLIKDNGSFDTDAYGNNITLTNGVQPNFQTYGVEVTPTTVFKTNTDVLRSGTGKLEYFTFGSGPNVLRGTIDFTNSLPLVLEKGSDDYYQVTLSDDYSGLVEHQILLVGYQRFDQ